MSASPLMRRSARRAGEYSVASGSVVSGSGEASDGDWQDRRRHGGSYRCCWTQ